jgi:hypothetical protein
LNALEARSARRTRTALADALLAAVRLERRAGSAAHSTVRGARIGLGYGKCDVHLDLVATLHGRLPLPRGGGDRLPEAVDGDDGALTRRLVRQQDAKRLRR